MNLGLNKSIYRGMLFSYIVVFLTVLCTVGILMSYFTQNYIMESKKQELIRKAKKVNMAFQNVKQFGEGEKKLLVFLDQSFNATIWIFDASGKIIATSRQDEVNIGKSIDALMVRKVMQGKETVQKMQFENLDEPTLSIIVPWGQDNVVYGGVILHAPINDVNETVSQVREMILWVTLLGTIIIIITVSYVSWSISRPIQQIDRAASKIGMGDYSQRIHIESVNEIGDLAITINNMAEKLETMDHDSKRQEQVRHDFLANVSHELRTPLTAVQGFLEALQDDLIEEEARKKYYDIIYNECIHMSGLVGDIMDLSRLKNNEIGLSKSPVEIGPLLHKIAFKFKREAAEKNILIQVNVDGDLSPIYADPLRMEQILNNIVKNAVKFTEAGRIELRAKREESFVHLAVEDTGIGISEGDIELIWERFFKVDRGRSKNNKGTGLGLAIVKELIELHDGSISMVSGLNKGTTVHIRIPLYV